MDITSDIGGFIQNHVTVRDAERAVRASDIHDTPIWWENKPALGVPGYTKRTAYQRRWEGGPIAWVGSILVPTSLLAP